MNVAAYVVSSLVWAAGGFAFGFLLGRAARELASINRKIAMDTDTDTGPDDRPNRTTKPRVERLFGVVLVVLALLSVIGVGVQSWRLNDTTACQAEWNDAYTDALRKRSAAAATEREAQRKLLLTMLSAASVEERRAALQTYLDSLAEADRERDDARIPARECT